MQLDVIIINLSVLLLVLEQQSVWKFILYFYNVNFFMVKSIYKNLSY